MDEVKTLELLRDKKFREEEPVWEFYNTVWDMLKFNHRYFDMIPEEMIEKVKFDEDGVPYFEEEVIKEASPEELKGMIAYIKRYIDYSAGDYADIGGANGAMKIAHEKYLVKILDELIKKIKYKNN